MTLEDDFTDIISKAQRGRNLAGSELPRRAGIDEATWRSLKTGKLNESPLSKTAAVLHLNFPARRAVALGEYRPRLSPNHSRAVFFDTGADGHPMHEAACGLGLTLKCIFTTHTHADHILDLSRLHEKPAPALL